MFANWHTTANMEFVGDSNPSIFFVHFSRPSKSFNCHNTSFVLKINAISLGGTLKSSVIYNPRARLSTTHSFSVIQLILNHSCDESQLARVPPQRPRFGSVSARFYDPNTFYMIKQIIIRRAQISMKFYVNGFGVP